MNGQQRHSVSSTVAAIVVIAAIYVYFLIFAEFALLGLAERMANQRVSLRIAMSVLGLCGVSGSIMAAWFFREGRVEGALTSGFGACAATAYVATAASSPGLFVAGVAGVGLSLGWVTVTLAPALRALVGLKRLGLSCGAGTGIAYAICNVPVLFSASPDVQAFAGIAAALVGAVATKWIRAGRDVRDDASVYGHGWAAAVVVALLALVWLDSAAFYVIQHTTTLKAATWSGETILIGNALVHLVAALVAGAALDRGWGGWLLVLAAVLLGLACVALEHQVSRDAAKFIYTAGVSLYSVALVYLPAKTARPAFAAIVYALAGWGGSALGIGMAQDLHRIPTFFVVFAMCAVVTAVFLKVRNVRRAAPGIALCCIGAIFLATAELHAQTQDSLIERGRQVYVSEGCMHCHSQYVRPGVASDVQWWGPARTLSENLAGAPPLLGNRRQGPDLAMVGNRRSPDWQRLHLIDPRAVTPGSRMPVFAYLFSGDGERGEALVAYLSSLGRDSLAERLSQVAAWAPSREALAHPDDRRGGELFSKLCTSCHGNSGRANGPLTEKLMLRPPDFGHGEWRRVDPQDPSLTSALARIVKFGLPGTAMAGHEWLSDADTVALAVYVESLHKGPSRNP